VKLERGKTYFAIVFSTRDAPIPEVETYIYIGKDVFGKGKTPRPEHFFQSPWSYFEHGDFAESSHRENLADKTHGHITMMSEDMVETLVDLNGLIKALRELKNEPNADRYL
jgi:hypothetical protein